MIGAVFRSTEGEIPILHAADDAGFAAGFIVLHPDGHVGGGIHHDAAGIDGTEFVIGFEAEHGVGLHGKQRGDHHRKEGVQSC